MVHLVYAVQALYSSDYFKSLKDVKQDNVKDDVIFMMNSYCCPEDIAGKAGAVYSLKNADELKNELFKQLTGKDLKLRSWY